MQVTDLTNEVEIIELFEGFEVIDLTDDVEIIIL
jgi:hypothetical protein